MRLWWMSLLLVGCSALIEPDETRLGGDFDAGRIDAGDRDGGRDAGYDAGESGCRPFCEPGDVLVTCVDGEEVRASCQEQRAYCASGACRPWECMPGEHVCTSDLRGSGTCNERGSSLTVAACEMGCDPSTGLCITGPILCPGTPPVALGGSHRFDLCRAPGDNTYQRASGCDSTVTADSADATFVLTLTRETDVVIELSDDDSGVEVDTVVYVRRVCDEQGSQLVCDDDVPCEESTLPDGPIVCAGGFEVRQSRIRTRLGPGTYFIVADAFTYRAEGVMYRCGTVELSVREGT